MSSLNRVTLIGRLGADPEVRNFQSGGMVVNLRLATSEKWRDKASGEQKERTQWHAVAIFNEPVGKIAEQYCRKGDLVYVEGQLETRKWQDQSGADRYTTEVVLRPFNGGMRLLTGKRDGDGQGDDRGGSSGGYDRGGSQSDNRGGGYSGGGGQGQSSGGAGGYDDMSDEIPF